MDKVFSVDAPVTVVLFETVCFSAKFGILRYQVEEPQSG